MSRKTGTCNQHDAEKYSREDDQVEIFLLFSHFLHPFGFFNFIIISNKLEKHNLKHNLAWNRIMLINFVEFIVSSEN